MMPTKVPEKEAGERLWLLSWIGEYESTHPGRGPLPGSGASEQAAGPSAGRVHLSCGQ